MKSIILDCETTGLLLPSSAPIENQPRIIELALVVVENGAHKETHNWLIDPECEVGDVITKITGITNADLVGKPKFSELLEDIKRVFDGTEILIAHNAPFDVGMLSNELKRIGAYDDFVWPATTVCTVQEYHHLFGHRPKLTQLYERIIGNPLAQTHRASDDCMALLEILQADGFFESMA